MQANGSTGLGVSAVGRAKHTNLPIVPDRVSVQAHSNYIVLDRESVQAHGNNTMPDRESIQAQGIKQSSA